MREVRSRLRPVIFFVLRWRYPLLWAWVAYVAGRKPLVQGIDWVWFDYGRELLFRGVFACGPEFCVPDPDPDGPGGLHTYATEPRLHMGPLSLVAAAAAKAIYPGDGRIGVALVMCVLGPVAVLVVERAALRARGLTDALEQPLLALTTLVGGATFLFFWVDMVWIWGHLDELLVLFGAAVAIWSIVNGNPLLAGTAVGLSLAAKSSAVFLLPLLGALPRRQAVQAATLVLVLAAIGWLPFLLADPDSIEGIRGDARSVVRPASGAHALGLDLGPTPDWLRPVQAAVALGLAAFAVARRRWAAALLLAVAARLALDPATYSYYTAALLFAALAWDLFAGRFALPIWSVATSIAYYLVPRLFDDPRAGGLGRVAVAIGAAVVVLGVANALNRQARPTT